LSRGRFTLWRSMVRAALENSQNVFTVGKRLW
jgi:hypothetical protein